MVVKEDRWRYISVDFFGSSPELPKFISRFRSKVSELFGKIYLAESGLHFLNYTEKSVIIRCNHLSRHKIEATIQLLKSSKFLMTVRRVSGTIKSLESPREENG